MDYLWMDVETRNMGGMRAWRAAFPAARVVNVSWRIDIVDSDFVHIRGDAAHGWLHTVNMNRCRRFTDAAFVHLRGIQTLNMVHCRQLTEAAFVQLRGIRTLNVDCCSSVVKAAVAAILAEPAL